jgi:osmotically inducible lipoprotein OsmB
MKRIMMGLLVASLSIGTLTGCNTIGKENTGMLAGGVGGGIIGSAVTGGSTTGTIVGAVGGAFAGRAIASHY